MPLTLSEYTPGLNRAPLVIIALESLVDEHDTARDGAASLVGRLHELRFPLCVVGDRSTITQRILEGEPDTLIAHAVDTLHVLATSLSLGSAAWFLAIAPRRPVWQAHADETHVERLKERWYEALRAATPGWEAVYVTNAPIFTVMPAQLSTYVGLHYKFQTGAVPSATIVISETEDSVPMEFQSIHGSPLRQNPNANGWKLLAGLAK